MPRHLLTHKRLESDLKAALVRARETGTPVKISDGENLMLVVRASGTASWQVNCRLPGGVRKPFTIGAFPGVSLATAREEADRVRDLVARGIDPVLARRRASNAAAAERERRLFTVNLLLESWYAVNPQWSAGHRYDIEKAMKLDVLPFIGDRPARQIDRDDIRALLDRIERRGKTDKLSRVRQWLRAAFEHGVDRHDLPANPVDRVKRRSFRAHEFTHFAAITDPGRLAALLGAIDGYISPAPRIALQLLALVFVRPANIRSMRWTDVHLEDGVWEIPAGAMKKNRVFLVPLARQAVDLLQKVHTITAGGELVFPGRHGAMMSENTLNVILGRLGFKGEHTTHGFRATARTMLEEGGYPKDVLKKQLSHEPESRVEAAYNRAEYWPQRVEVMQAWADYLDAVRAGGATSAPRAHQWFETRRSAARSNR